MAEQANTVPRRDGWLLHFVKELPAWCVLVIIFLTVLAVYQFRQDDFIPRLLDQAFGGLLTALAINRARTGATNITTATVETPAVTTQTISDSTVNTENLNVENKEKT